MTATAAPPRSQEQVDWMNARSADGPGVAAWLRERQPDLMQGNSARTIRRWEAGNPADYYALDALLTRVGLHPLDVPEELWRAEARRRSSHCKRGHRMAGDNVYVDPKGCHVCRTCTRARKRRDALR